MVAYSGIVDGYIFNFGIGLPFYRYQTGPGQLSINTGANDSWPASNMYAFPSKIYVGGKTLQSTSFTEELLSGTDCGYCCDQYYASGTNTYVDVHLFVDGTTGIMWGGVSGTVNSNDFRATWDPTTQQFTADAGLGLGFAAPATSGSYGPPQIEWNSVLLPFRYRNADGSDVYGDSTGDIQIIIDANKNVTATQPYTTLTGTWDGNCFAGGDFGDPYNVDQSNWMYPQLNYVDIAAVSANGLQIISNPGILYTVYAQAGVDPGNFQFCIGWEDNPMCWNRINIGSRYSLQRSNGTMEYMYIPAWIDIGWYHGDGYCAFSNMPGVFPFIQSGTIDATNGWPASGVLPLPDQPWVIYVNGAEYDFYYDGSTDGDGCTFFASNYAPPAECNSQWQTPADAINLYCSVNATGTNVNIYNYWDGTSGSFTSLNGYSTDGRVYLSTLGPAVYGPQQITWNGRIFTCVGSSNGSDTYASGTDWQVTISGSGVVTVTGTHSATGTYNATTYAFNFGSDTAMAGFYAQDSNGNLLGVGVGLTINVTNTNTTTAPPSGWMDTSARQIRLGNGTVLTATGGIIGFAYQHTTNSVGAKYPGISQGMLFQIADSMGNFTSPVYRYSSTSGSDFVVHANHDYADPNSYSWDNSTIFPSVIYVNGLYCSRNDSSKSSVTGGDISTSSVDYIIPTSTVPGGTVCMSWVFSNSGFLGRITGTYAGSVINGSWDGNELFGNIPSGIIISTTQPPSAIRYGPKQISWNGTVLTFSANGSSKTASNPSGGDLYIDPSGSSMSILIGSDGTVTYTSVDGTQTTGTYSSTTGQFTSNGQADGSVVALDSAGNQTNRSGTGTVGSVGSVTEMLGSLDIQGNFLTLGSWLNASNQSVEGLSISYTDAKNQQPALLHFASVRRSVTWVWSHAHSDGSTTQDITMQMDSGNRLRLYDPATQNSGTTVAQPTIILDPSASGTSQIKGVILIQPKGDLQMGSFTHGPVPQ